MTEPLVLPGPVNGCVVLIRDSVGEFQYVYQQQETEEADIGAWADLLRLITERHGPADQGRHASHRLYIRVAPGDKNAGYVADPYEMEHNRPVLDKTPEDLGESPQVHAGPSL